MKNRIETGNLRENTDPVVPPMDIPGDLEFGEIDGYTPLHESARSSLSTGTGALVKVIAPGWTRDGKRYYPANVLKRDIAKAFPEGTKVFADHRPRNGGRKTEGSVLNMAGHTTAAAFYMDNGPDGPGAYAQVNILESWLPKVREWAGVAGISIDNGGAFHQGEAEGRKGTIVRGLYNDNLPSIDIVTDANCDGKIISLREATEAVAPQQQEETTVTEQEAQQLRTDLAAAQARSTALETQVTTQNATIGSMREAATARAAKDYVEAKIPAHVTGERRIALVESLTAQAPVTAEGALDEAKFGPLVESITAVMQPASGVRGMGGQGLPAPKTSDKPRGSSMVSRAMGI